MVSQRKSKVDGPCKRCSKQLQYVYQVWLHPGEWIRWSTKWMNEYTNQRVLTRFAAFEVINSICAVSFFAWVRWVTDLDGLDSQWFLFNLSMVYRSAYGLVGLRAAWNRKVRFTWAFSGMMVVNAIIMLTAMLELSRFSCIRTPSISIMAPWENHQYWTNNTNQDLLLLSYFDIPNPRIYFKSGPLAPQPKCEPIDRADAFDPYDIEASLLAVRKRQSWSDPGTLKPNATPEFEEDLREREEGWWTSSPLLLRLMDGYLRECMLMLDCSLVEVRLQREGSDEPMGLRVCTYPLNVVPYVDHTFACTDRRADTAGHGCVLPDASVFFLKDVAKSARQALAFGQIEDEQEVVCHLSRDILIGVIFLLIASNSLMFVITVKFAMNRCGDHFDAEIQFNVEFSSDEDDYSEDGSWISTVSVATLATEHERDGRRRSRKSISRRQSRGSVLRRSSFSRRSLAAQRQPNDPQEIEMSSPWKMSALAELSPRKSVRFATEAGERGGDAEGHSEVAQADSFEEPGAQNSWPLNWGFR